MSVPVPPIVDDAAKSGMVVQLISEERGQWRITPPQGLAFHFWASTERWFSVHVCRRLEGRGAATLREQLGLSPYGVTA